MECSTYILYIPLKECNQCYGKGEDDDEGEEKDEVNLVSCLTLSGQNWWQQQHATLAEQSWRDQLHVVALIVEDARYF